eukprot:g13564.t1
MPHKTLILSDTHLGKPGSPRADALRPVWQGVDELVINGDAAEVQIPWLRGTAVRELDRLEELARQDGIRVTLISGNHDAYLTDRRCLQLAEGSILVMHGDALHPAVAPWTRHANALQVRTERELARAEQKDLATRLDIAQHIGHSEFLKEYVISSLGESTLRRILARPIEVPRVLWYWRREPAFAELFMQDYAPKAKVLIVGHSHRRGVWQRGGRTIINTGAFMFPGKPHLAMSQPSNAVALEVCVDSLTSGLIAARLGAARIEINSALELGGLTCSIGLVEAVVQQVKPLGCAVIAMVRPRPGGFAYGAEEQRVMKRDIQALIRAGVDGIALGVLKPTGGVDAEAVRQLIKPVLAAGKQAVFHRAFDLVPNPVAALQTLIKLGVTRVLTSGQAPTAIEGAALIRRLIEQADGQIEVLPGSGITPSNIPPA